MYSHFVAVESFSVEGNALDLDATHGVLGIQTDEGRFGHGYFGAIGQNLNVFKAYIVNTAVLAVL